MAFLTILNSPITPMRFGIIIRPFIVSDMLQNKQTNIYGRKAGESLEGIIYTYVYFKKNCKKYSKKNL